MLSNPDPPGRIMVVDDDATIVDVVRRYLIRDGHEVDCVLDGAAALRLVEQEPPDLVVLDLMLPGIGGLEVCRRLREHWPIPVVMLTALGEETDRVVGFETGADDYVTKPFSPRELALRVRSVLRRARGGGLAGQPARGTIGDGELADRPQRARGPAWHRAAGADLARIRPAGVPAQPSAAGIQPRAAAGAGVELVIRRHLDGHGACAQASGEDRAGPDAAAADRHGMGSWLPV